MLLRYAANNVQIIRRGIARIFQRIMFIQVEHASVAAPYLRSRIHVFFESAHLACNEWISAP